MGSRNSKGRIAPLLAAVLACGFAGHAWALTSVQIGNGTASPDGTYLNAGNLTNTLCFTNVTVTATNNIDIVDPIDLSFSPTFGPAAGNLNLQAPIFNVIQNMNMSANSGVSFSGVSTVNLTGKITSPAGLIAPSRIFSNTGVSQVNVLANTASVQQAVNISTSTSAPTIQITTGQINENVSIGKSLTLTTSNASGQTNHGVLAITSSSSTATLTGAGFTNAPGAMIEGIGVFDATALTGSGFVNHGTLAPGLSPGILSLTGNYDQASDGEIDIEIGGTTVGSQYDSFAITGSATLGGQLHPTLINSYIPSPTDSFTILTTGSRSGTFSNAASFVNTGNGFFAVNYTPTSVILSNFQVPEPGSLALLALGIPLTLRRRTARDNVPSRL